MQAPLGTVFACLGAGEMSQPEMAASNALLGEAGSRFVVCCNRPENDEHWQSSAPEWVGKASMSQVRVRVRVRVRVSVRVRVRGYCEG